MRKGVDMRGCAKAAIACVMVGVGMVGCASRGGSGTMDTVTVTGMGTGGSGMASGGSGPRKGAQPPPVQMLETPATPMDAGKLTIAAARTLVYDTDQGGRMTVVQDALPDCHCAGRSWWVKYYAGNAGGATGVPERELRMTIDMNGYISTTEEINRIDKVEIEYTPPLVVIPDKLPVESTGNAGFEQTVRMVVHPLGKRDKVKTSGTAHNAVRYAGDERVRTGAGEFTGRKLLSTVTADLSLAKSVNTSEQWWADGVGLLMKREHEATRGPLGFKIRDNQTMMILSSISEGGTGAPAAR